MGACIGDTAAAAERALAAIVAGIAAEGTRETSWRRRLKLKKASGDISSIPLWIVCLAGE
jgi:hypothetical protein